MKNDKYEVVIGLEVHAQLLTKSKIFCGDSAAFGGAPNTHISPVTLAHPGSLPKMNKKAIEYAVKLGIALHCDIEQHNYFARKNYFYPDLPKGYQISQHTTPICKNGIVKIKVGDTERNIRLNRIHMEEDAGKSLHDVDEKYTAIDLNRAGVALLEIVSEPDLHSSEEAFAYVTELRRLVRWIDICDGNMEEGSMRCDANISIRLKGATKLGTRVEVKNLNSIRNVKHAIQYEIERMVQIVEAGGKITQQTRSFDATTDTTFSIRDKEEANDYRYFAEPDLAPFLLSEPFIESVKNSLPALPQALQNKYIHEHGLSEYDAAQLCMEKEMTDYFEALITHTTNYKAAANWMNGPVKHYLHEHKIVLKDFSLQPAELAGLLKLVEEGVVNFSIASTKLLPVLVTAKDTTALQLATELNLLQVSDTNELETWVQVALDKMPDKVKEYQKGKKGLIGLFVGEVKKLSKGKADPKVVTELLERKLNTPMPPSPKGAK